MADEKKTRKKSAAAVPEAVEEAVSAEAEPVAEVPASPAKEPKAPRRAAKAPRAKPKREQSKGRKPIVRTAAEESVPGRRQERRGVVVSDKGDKSIVVKVEMIRAHVKYKKVVRRSNRLHAHDEQNSAGIGDVVRIVETRPLSKTKRWRLAEIIEKAK